MQCGRLLRKSEFRLAAFPAVILAGDAVPTSLYSIPKQSCDSRLQMCGYLASLKVRERMLLGFPTWPVSHECCGHAFGLWLKRRTYACQTSLFCSLSCLCHYCTEFQALQYYSSGRNAVLRAITTDGKIVRFRCLPPCQGLAKGVVRNPVERNEQGGSTIHVGMRESRLVGSNLSMKLVIQSVRGSPWSAVTTG